MKAEPKRSNTMVLGGLTFTVNHVAEGVNFIEVSQFFQQKFGQQPETPKPAKPSWISNVASGMARLFGASATDTTPKDATDSRPTYLEGYRALDAFCEKHGVGYANFDKNRFNTIQEALDQNYAPLWLVVLKLREFSPAVCFYETMDWDDKA